MTELPGTDDHFLTLASIHGSHRYHLVAAGGLPVAELGRRPALCGTRPIRAWQWTDDLLLCGRCAAVHLAIRARPLPGSILGRISSQRRDCGH